MSRNVNVNSSDGWVFIALCMIFFWNWGDNQFDLYDLIYQLLSKQIGN